MKFDMTFDEAKARIAELTQDRVLCRREAEELKFLRQDVWRVEVLGQAWVC